MGTGSGIWARIRIGGTKLIGTVLTQRQEKPYVHWHSRGLFVLYAMRLPFASAACEARMTESDTSIT
jgi:hypothetical protein